MNNSLRNRFCTLVLSLSLLTALRAPAQVTPGSSLTLTNLPATIAATTGSNQVSVIPLVQNTGLSLQWIWNVSSGTGTSGLYIYPSVDGINPATTNSWTLLQTATGTTNVVATTNWSAATLAGYSCLFVGTVTNATAGTLTNKGVIVNRWNPPRAF